MNEAKREEYAATLATIIDDMGVEFVLQRIYDQCERTIEKFNLTGKDAQKLRDTCARLIGTWTYQ